MNVKLTIWKKIPNTNIRLHKAHEVKLEGNGPEIRQALKGAMEANPDWAQIMLTKSHKDMKEL